MAEFVRSYETRSKEYEQAFQVFLAHTDEKKQIHGWLQRLVADMPVRNLYIDAGAGNGALTARLQGAFRHTIAIEPSPALLPALERNCPGAEILGKPILAAEPSAPGDLVLCSHVLYYVAENEWLRHLEQLASWLAPEGVLAVLLQSHDCDCTELLAHFTGRRPNLPALSEVFEDRHGDRYTLVRERVPASVESNDFEAAYTVAEFMLNLMPIREPVPRREVEGVRHRPVRHIVGLSPEPRSGLPGDPPETGRYTKSAVR